jgi:predicted nucleotidyltransferase component of viral defense system
MIPQAFIEHWQQQVLWTSDTQIEQDLILNRALVEIFNHPLLAGSLALRGGTSFNKLYAPEGSRYSEDIDLVQVKAESIGDTLDAIRSLLDPWLGEPRRRASEGNSSLRYRFTAEGPAAMQSGLKVEIDTREHFTVFGYAQHAYAMDSPWFSEKHM